MPTILIVEDEAVIAEMLADLFTDEGYQVQVARNGREALSFLDKLLPDLVLSDVMMPVMDGRALCEAMAQHPKHRNIPIILMSAGGDMIKLDHSRYVAFIAKPFSLHTVLDSVARIVG